MWNKYEPSLYVHEDATKTWIDVPETGNDEFTDSRWNFHCSHPEHDAPNMIVIPYGKYLKHTCPACKRVQIICSQNVRF